MLASLAAACCFALAGSSVLAQQPEDAVGGFEGIWKMCYSPQLGGVTEIDEGYLVLMPGGEYYEVAMSCCHMEGPRPPYWERNSYRVEDASVVLTNKTYVGTTTERRLRLQEKVPTVVFDEPRGTPKMRDVLSAGDSVDYAYCRVYPRWPVREAPHDNPLQ